MKSGIHPDNYRLVVFKDMSNDYSFVTKSCAESKETIKWEDGNEYPVIKLEISHKSHPFYTGKMQLVDTAGRIDKFKNKYAKFKKAAPVAEQSAPTKEAKNTETKAPEGSQEENTEG